MDFVYVNVCLANINSRFTDYYWQQRSWAKVMFLQVCVILFTGAVSASVHAGYHPWEQTPSRADTPRSRHPLGADTPQEQTPPGSRHPPGADTPLGADTPQEQTPPRADTPRCRHPPPPRADTPPGSRLWHTVNKWPVRILLECILVTVKLLPFKNPEYVV